MKINLAEAKQQYFKLLTDLSKSNRKSKEKNKLYFCINEDSSTRRLYGAISPEQKLMLTKTNKFNWWIAVEPTDYESLSQFVTCFANANTYTSDFSDQLISNLFRFQDK